MNRLCTTPFWDKSVTNAPYPYLTECFRDTALQWLPIGIFWVVFPLWISMLHKRKIQPKPLPYSALFIAKMILTMLFLIVQIVRIVNYFLSSSSHKTLSNLISPILYIVTLLVIVWLMNYDRQKGMFCSGLLFSFWLTVSLTIIPDVIDYTLEYKQGNQSANILKEVIRVWLHFLFALGSFIINCFAERYVFPKLASDERPVVPELYSSFPSRLTYAWVTPLILRGFKHPLIEEDCWQLEISERAVHVIARVQACFEGSFDRAKSIAYKKTRHLDGNINSTPKQTEEESQDLLGEIPAVKIKKRSKPISVWRTLLRAYLGKFLAGGLVKLTYDILQFSSPMILKEILTFLSNPNQPKWVGIFYAILMGSVVFCQTLFLQAYFHRQYVVGIRFRSAITALVYRKSLKLSNSAKQGTTTGEIVNLMSIDAARFGELTSYVHVLWSGPFQITLALTLLYRQMQLAIIPGVILLLLLIPLNLYIQNYQKKLVTKQMKLKDQRIKMMNEMLNGIRVLKLYAWEVAFIRRINDIREKELKNIRLKAVINAISNAIWTFAPILVCIATFATYVLSSDQNILTAEKAFVSLALFNLLRFPLVVFPSIINSVVEANVSNKRIQNFLNSEEIDENAVNRTTSSANGYAVRIVNGSFRWSNADDDPLILKNINLQIPSGTLVALVGTVGSGKSSILSSLLGEMSKTNGQVNVHGSVAYVPQTAWVLNATLKDNILFGKELNEKLYEQVIEACALKPDFDILPQHDQTEIGEKGINLSGGQRQRVSLARALYSEADIYLFDDPLSAVDAHVGAHIFKHAIGPKGLLKDKTRLLVTHGVSHLSKCNEIVVVARGEIVDNGSYNELMTKSKILRELVHSIKTGESQRKSSDPIEPRTPVTPPVELLEDVLKVAEDDLEHDIAKPATVEITPSEMQENKEKLIQKETVETGSVKFNVFLIYIRACTIPLILTIFCLFCLTAAFALSTNIWLSRWTDQSKKGTIATNQTSPRIDKIHGLTVYSILGCCQGFAAFAMQLFVYLAGYAASRQLHALILSGVLRAPMAFFDTTPIGRIINRFAKDIESIDSSLPSSFSSAFGTSISILITVIILLYGSWLAIFALIPLAIVFAFIQRVYVASSRQLRRLDSTTRSPVYSNFGETIQGLSSIRAYQAQQRFIDSSDRLLDRNQSCYFASCIVNRWLAVRLESIANALTFFTALFAVLMRDRLTPGIAGLVITYSMQITQTLNWLVRMTSDIETNIVSVERIHEYAELTPEAPWEIAEKKPPADWPNAGEIQLKHLSTRYRENLELVLKDVTVNIQPGEKIGIIGRTGSGKSSLCIALFRIVEPADGEIIIDKIDVRHIGLHDLRSKITIIPQDAVIFAGTVRFNVDPFGLYSDVEIWSALELVHMKERIRSMEDGLSHLLTEGGENLSAGERQLLCMARALLRKSKIFVLDEATAAIDMETDRLIQLTIRTVFKDATVLTIAHRLHTILDSSKILVLSNGRVEEFDEPRRLADNPQSSFSKLLRDANIQLSNVSSFSG